MSHFLWRREQQSLPAAAFIYPDCMYCRCCCCCCCSDHRSLNRYILPPGSIHHHHHRSRPVRCRDQTIPGTGMQPCDPCNIRSSSAAPKTWLSLSPHRVNLCAYVTVRIRACECVGKRRASGSGRRGKEKGKGYVS